MKTTKRKRIAFTLFAIVLVIGGLPLYKSVHQQYCDQALIAAIKNGDRTAVGALLAAGANPNIRTSIIRQATFRGQIERLLRRSGAIDAPDERMNAPVLCGCPEQVYGTDVFDVAPEDPVITETLLRYGATVNATDGYGQTALGWAVSLHRVQTVRLLLKYGANPHTSMQMTDALKIARSPTHDRVLLRSAYRETLLQDAFESTLIDERNGDIVRLLVVREAADHSVDDHRVSPLTIAALEGDRPAVQSLLKGATKYNASSEASTALYWLNECTSSPGDAETKCLLVKAGGKE